MAKHPLQELSPRAVWIASGYPRARGAGHGGTQPSSGRGRGPYPVLCPCAGAWPHPSLSTSARRQCPTSTSFRYRSPTSKELPFCRKNFSDVPVRASIGRHDAGWTGDDWSQEHRQGTGCNGDGCQCRGTGSMLDGSCLAAPPCRGCLDGGRSTSIAARHSSHRGHGSLFRHSRASPGTSYCGGLWCCLCGNGILCRRGDVVAAQTRVALSSCLFRYHLGCCPLSIRHGAADSFIERSLLACSSL
jgi:hypothetical protein